MKINKNSAKNIDFQVRQFWENKGYKINSDYYFAATSSNNWYGFIEGINDCIENPTWEEIKEFVKYYCTHLKKNTNPITNCIMNLKGKVILLSWRKNM